MFILTVKILLNQGEALLCQSLCISNIKPTSLHFFRTSSASGVEKLHIKTIELLKSI